ncbi:MAG TPA: M24 family metallopeptidase [Verrucomicrobiae bacterium]|jgi:Xaa-Pro aminopeptidase|nr:M24 family metallopeptidase [Verrucomicrobiae bacterium]
MINSGERGFGLPKFSAAERERRWGRVRELMREAGLEAIIGFPNQSHWDQFQADIRYLTHIGGHQTEVAVVFPLAGDVTAFVRGANEVAWWSIAQDWVKDIRQTRRTWGDPVIERMKELKLDSARVGVSGLSGLLRAPEGTVVSGMLEKVKKAFPSGRYENATELLQDARAVKGKEEVAWIERAAGILDRVVDAILAKARPGVMENEVVAEIWRTIIANGGDYPSMTHWGAGKDIPWACRIAPHRKLEAGDMINTELEAKYGGYIAQTIQAACLGKIPGELKRAFNASVEIFDDLVEYMKPGVTFREVIARYQQRVRESGHIPKGMLLHGRGIGEDRPQVTGEADVGYTTAQYTMHLDIPLVEGNVMVLKPGAMPSDAPDSIRCGDTVVIEAKGARRLGKRKFTFPEIG